MNHLRPKFEAYLKRHKPNFPIAFNEACNQYVSAGTQHQWEGFKAASIPDEELVKQYWHKHYTPKGLCSLCGNSGKIDTTGVKTNAGVEVGMVNHCICPNGQMARVLDCIDPPAVLPDKLAACMINPEIKLSVVGFKPGCGIIGDAEDFWPILRTKVCKHESVDVTEMGWRCRACGASV